jgi:membrane fusion protein, multidrug efflux system
MGPNMCSRRWLLSGIALVGLSACNESNSPSAQIRPVRAVSVEHRALSEPMALTGQIRAQEEVNLAFRLDGKLLRRFVSVGQHVIEGQVVARLDSQDEENALSAAEADNNAAQSVYSQAQRTEQRQKEALARGAISRPDYDQAFQQMQTAKAQASAAQARRHAAQDRVGYTDLHAEFAGTVTAKGAEAGEIVRAGQLIVQVARDGQKDAVFDVPASLMLRSDISSDATIEMRLADNPQIRARGRVREVAPQADPVTRTFAVRIALYDPPSEMLLGSTVSGSLSFNAASVIEIPSMALFESDGKPAVWVFDEAKQTVAVRNVEVARFGTNSVIISQGLRDGEVVVTAGVQVLRPGQKVKLLGGTS